MGDVTRVIKKMPVPAEFVVTPAIGAGRMLRHVRSSGFKIALVVGHVSDGTARLRMRMWRDVSGQWTQPQLIRTRHLRPLTAEQLKGRKRLIARASVAAILEGYARLPAVVHLTK